MEELDDLVAAFARRLGKGGVPKEGDA